MAGVLTSGARGTRTPDLLGAIQALSQLSYSPERRRPREEGLNPAVLGSAAGQARLRAGTGPRLA